MKRNRVLKNKLFFILLLILLNFNILYAQQLVLPDPIPIQNNKSQSFSDLPLKYPYLVEYYGQVIPIVVPFSIPIIIELPDIVAEKTVESSLSGLEVYPKSREETKIIKLMATTNVNRETVLHVKLVSGMVLTFAVKIVKINKNTDVFQFNTRYKVIDKIHTKQNQPMGYIKQIRVDSPDVVNYAVDRLAYQQLLALAGLNEDIPVKDTDYTVSEDKNRVIKIKKYTVASTIITIKSALKGNDKRVPVMLFGLKTYFCNKKTTPYWVLNVDYIKNIFPEYYKISYNKEVDSIIEPNKCVPVYVIIWENIKN
ncbi:hypothetical protein DEFDS_P027 (plasmid) [Deferribacter desulfuricans SSM1]|uniref:Uncharacterized protein n=1 Tax=Deferribacter desulfuricans (strain DSM 14783 / JCM 11476 / NBRC 101012 / SSM1) TaxID=639282 RepID=D3PEL3_DEFDS|nr:hypothetical protein [Deferribacter desulfuricans]BAI81655.1 hypothetical protein DEFDS_P027 [Deferribacter desulfuricans SSM1]